ncbi:MAG: hypothetical protein MUE41_04460 [Gemmatimonadaceae bacterium]|nr:hypothetical protein [Gemmatimonadaceae bacterium]
MSGRRPAAACLLALVVLTGTAACDRREGNELFADGANVDSLAARGDSVAALAMRGFTAADSARAGAEGAQRVRDEISQRTLDTARAAPKSVAQPPVAETAAGQVIVGRTPVMSPPTATDLPASSRVPPPPLGDADARSRALGDSVRGIAAVVGTAPMTQVVVKLADGASITLNGMAASDVGRLAGAEVVVRGVRTSPLELVVADYAVRRVDGADAADGMLIATADGLALLARDGTRRPVSNAPPALRAMVGSRVWIAGSLERPTAFGRIGRR